jgi:glycosyltransferase involved in cell wall biosynthesis
MRIGFDGTPLLGQRSGVGHYTGRLLAQLVKQYPEWEYLLFSNYPLAPLEGDLAQHAPHCPPLYEPLCLDAAHPAAHHSADGAAPVPFPQQHCAVLPQLPVDYYHSRCIALFTQPHPPHQPPAGAAPAAAARGPAGHGRYHRVPPRPPGFDPRLAAARRKNSRHPRSRAGQFSAVDDPIQRQQLRLRYNLPEKFILFVGTIEPRKNLSRLIQAVAQLRRRGCATRLVLVGPNGWLVNGSLEQEIETLGVKDVVQNLGYVPQEDLPGLYSLATVFAFPSLYEGFGLPPLEAMACGTPVLTSQDSAMAEICGEAALLVDPHSAEAIADGLATLLQDADLRDCLRQRGLVQVQQYSWERTARETAVVYQKVLNGSQP